MGLAPIPAAALRSNLMPTPVEVARELLSPSGASLFKAFQPASKAVQQERFDQIASRFSVELALTGAGFESSARDSDVRRWETLLLAASKVRLGDGDLDDRQKLEVEAIVKALLDIANSTEAPVAGENASKDERGTVWFRASTHLGSPGTWGALRSRRWPELRAKLATRLGVLVQRGQEKGQPWIPDAIQPSLFEPSMFYTMLDRLNTGPGAGLYVLAGRPGDGKTQFSAQYAEWAKNSAAGRRRYDLVMWVQGADPSALEWDFSRIALAIGHQGNIDDVLRGLPHDRWLLVADDVRDPAWLLRYVPKRIRGHLLATTDFDLGRWDWTSGPNREQQLGSLACIGWQHYWSAPLAESGTGGILQLTADSVESLEIQEPAVRELIASEELNRLAVGLLGQLLGTFPSQQSLNDRYRAALQHTTDLLSKQEALDRSAAELNQSRFDPSRRSTSAIAGPAWSGLVAAVALLDEAFRDPERFSAEKDPSVSALELLRRLASFTCNPIPVSAVRETNKDARLIVLEERGLVTRHRRGAADEQVVMNPEVRRAVNLLVSFWDNSTYGQREYVVPIVTALTLRGISEVLDDPDLDAQQRLLLPHLAPVANAITQPNDRSFVFPVLAIELISRAAAIHWKTRSYRAAAVQISELRNLVRDPVMQGFITEDIRTGREMGLEVEGLPAHAIEMKDGQQIASPAVRLRGAIVALRRTGFRSGAERLYVYLRPCFENALGETVTEPSGSKALRQTELCRFHFEGALCSRENEPRSKAEIEEEISDSGVEAVAEKRRYTTRDLLTKKVRPLAVDSDDIARCEALLAVDEQDHDQFALARRHHETSLSLRAEIAREIDLAMGGQNTSENRKAIRPWVRSREELGRGHFAYARGLHYAGLPIATIAAAQLSVLAWESVNPLDKPHSIHRATAKSTLALALSAIRSHDAEIVATEAANEAAAAMRGLTHPDLALVLLQQAVVASRSDDASGVAGRGDAEARIVIGHWPRSHPLVLESRLLAAACRSEAGNVHEALDHLLVLLPDASDRDNTIVASSPTLNRPAVRASAWTQIGNLLLDAAPRVLIDSDLDRDVERSRHATARQCVDLARRAFDVAIALHDNRRSEQWSDDRRYRSIRLLDAQLGALECDLRIGGGEPSVAAELVRAAQSSREYDELSASAILGRTGGLDDLTLLTESTGGKHSILETRAMAKHSRAVANAGGTADQASDHFAPAFWLELSDQLANEKLPFHFTPRDRAEIFLATASLLLRQHRTQESEETRLFITRLNQQIAADIDLLRSAEEPVAPQIALRWAIRAELNGGIGDPGDNGQLDALQKQSQRKARSLREADRSRVLLGENIIEVLHRALAEDRFTKSSFPADPSRNRRQTIRSN
jgi:hypothetical protein